MEHAYGACTWSMHMEHAHGACIWSMHMEHAYGACIWSMHMERACTLGHMHACTHTWPHACIYPRVATCVHIPTCGHMHAYTHRYVSPWRVSCSRQSSARWSDCWTRPTVPKRPQSRRRRSPSPISRASSPRAASPSSKQVHTYACMHACVRACVHVWVHMHAPGCMYAYPRTCHPRGS